MAGFVEELKRRHIYRIGAAYVVVAWLLVQLYNNMTPLLRVPGWAGTLILVLLIGGFPVALIFAWSLDVDARRAEKANAAAAKVTPPGQAKHAAPVETFAAPDHDGMAPAVPAAQRSPSPAPHAGEETLRPCGNSGESIAEPYGPSVMVLPFHNLSGDPGQDFFADGLTEDIITELSRFRHLFIISRNTAFRYRGKVVDVG